MKGLLYKDLLAAVSYLRIMLVICVVFACMAMVPDSGPIFVYYPAILLGISTISLLSYEEKEKWDLFVALTPASPALRVGSKYLMTLFFALAGALLQLLVHGIPALTRGSPASDLITMALVFFCLGMLPSMLLLPFVYRYGVEKGRILYYIICGVGCGISMNLPIGASTFVLTPVLAAAVTVILLGLFALSYGISVKVVEKKEY